MTSVGSAGRPPVDVVGVGPARWGVAAGDHAAAVAGGEEPSLGGGGGAYRVPEQELVRVDGFDDRVAREAGQPRRGQGAEVLLFSGGEVDDDLGPVGLGPPLAHLLERDPGHQPGGVGLPLPLAAIVGDRQLTLRIHRHRRRERVERGQERRTVRRIQLPPDDHHPGPIHRGRQFPPVEGVRVERVLPVGVQPVQQVLGRLVGLQRRQTLRGLGEPGVHLAHRLGVADQVPGDLLQHPHRTIHMLPGHLTRGQRLTQHRQLLGERVRGADVGRRAGAAQLVPRERHRHPTRPRTRHRTRPRIQLQQVPQVGRLGLLQPAERVLGRVTQLACR